MSSRTSQPILVTGSHRSGSTWVGQMIAQSPAVTYIHEPFNIDPRSGCCGGVFENWFTYVCDDNASLYEAHLRTCLSFDYPLEAKLRAHPSPWHVSRTLAEWARYRKPADPASRPLMKDPLAVFSAEWLARTFGMQVVVLTRHPAAFASSLKRANWPHPFRHFLDQPLLLRDHLSGFVAEIEAFTSVEHDIVDQAILLWNMIHATILKYRERHAGWYFRRHEDISVAPLVEFGRIYGYLGLAYSPDIQSDILAYSSDGKQPGEAEDLLSIRRDSRYNLRRWKDRLTDDEIARVRAGTRHISDHFYDAADW